ITLRERTSIRTGSQSGCAMIRMKGVLKVVVAEVKDTMVDSEDEAMVVEEVSSLMEHVYTFGSPNHYRCECPQNITFSFCGKSHIYEECPDLYEHL
ncbi:hypothetical protein KI387_031292, partial [Taxus chinensis]